MRQTVPEDLSDLPDFEPGPETEEEAPPAAAIPEDVAHLPDAAPPPEDQGQPAPEPTRVPWGKVIGLGVVAGGVATLAVVLAVTEMTELVLSSFRVSPVLGWLGAVSLAVVVAALGVLVQREVRGYLRLRSIDELRASFERVKCEPRNPDAHREVRRVTEDFLDYLDRRPNAEMAVMLERLRSRLFIAGNVQEWEEDIDRVLLRPLDEQVYEAIRHEAVNVGIGTAISPSGFLDAIIVTWRNVRLIRRIASTYRVRAGFWGTLVILRRTVVAAALADLAHEASVALLGTTRSLSSILGGPLAQGIANSGLTVRLGLKALEQCRPLPMPAERKRGLVRMLFSSVGSGVKRLARNGKKQDEEPLEPEQPDDDQAPTGTT